MASRFLRVGLVSLVVSACTTVPTLTTTEASVQRQVVEGQIDTWAQAMNNANVGTVTGMYRDAASTLWAWHDGSRAVGTEEVNQAINDFYSRVQYMNFVPQNASIDFIGPFVAVTSFRYSMDIRNLDTTRDVSSGVGLLVWQRADEESPWMIAFQQISPTS